MSAFDIAPVAEDLLPFLETAGGSAEHHACRLFIRKGFARALGYEFALYFRREGECKRYYLGVEIVVEVEIVLDGVDAYAALGAFVEDTHYHEHIAPETGDFRADEEVAGLHSADGGAEFAFARGDGARRRFFDPTVDADGLPAGPAVDFVFLTGAGLSVRADSHISIIHGSL